MSNSTDDEQEEVELIRFRNSISRFALSAAPLPNTSQTSVKPVKQVVSSCTRSKKRASPSVGIDRHPSPGKRRQKSSPESFDHLQNLTDYLAPGLDIIFCGINPGYKSAETGHHFAHYSNHFWKCLHESGLTPTRIPPEEDQTLPERFNYGMTNLVDRSSRSQSDLRPEELGKGVSPLLIKIFRYKPRIVCFIGIGIWNVVERHLRLMCAHPLPSTNVEPGLKPYKIVHSHEDTGLKQSQDFKETLFFGVPSTSARVTAFQLAEKVAYFAQLKDTLLAVQSSVLPTSQMVAIPKCS